MTVPTANTIERQTALQRWLRIDHQIKSKVYAQMYETADISSVNYWLEIIFSACIASLGLALNSPAVIIGAMLISPLMGPIMATGLALAAGDLYLALKAIANLVVSIALAVRNLIAFLPVLAYDGADMLQVDAGKILDTAIAGISGTLLARRWQSALLVNVDNDTLRRVMNNPDAMAAVERIEGWRALGKDVLQTIINKSQKVKSLRNKAKDGKLTANEKSELSKEQRKFKSKRQEVQTKLIKFATRIPAFMYLTDFRENSLRDVITKLESDLFLTVTGLSKEDFHLLVDLKVFNTEQMNQAVFAFRRYEDASLRYTGIESHEGLAHYGLYDTVVGREQSAL